VRRMDEEAGAGLEIEEKIEKGDVLDGADFVVISIAIDRMNRCRKDWEISFKKGIKQVIGE